MKQRYRDVVTYTMLSNFTTTFVFCYSDENETLLVSPPLPHSEFLKSIFFVLALKLRSFYKDKLDWLFRPISILSQDSSFFFLSKPQPAQNKPNKPSNPYNLRAKMKKNVDGKNDADLDASTLQSLMNDNVQLVGTGRTCFVCTVQRGHSVVALKLIDIFKPAFGALEELENEYHVLRFLKGNLYYRTLYLFLNKSFDAGNIFKRNIICAQSLLLWKPRWISSPRCYIF